jgi:hypothetical protein
MIVCQPISFWFGGFSCRYGTTLGTTCLQITMFQTAVSRTCGCPRQFTVEAKI